MHATSAQRRLKLHGNKAGPALLGWVRWLGLGWLGWLAQRYRRVTGVRAAAGCYGPLFAVLPPICEDCQGGFGQPRRQVREPASVLSDLRNVSGDSPTWSTKSANVSANSCSSARVSRDIRQICQHCRQVSRDIRQIR